MNATQVSVAAVITYYRNKLHVHEAVESVLAQTRTLDEIVVVDDASPDDELLLDGLDPRVRVIRHERNLGPGAARQTGVDATTSTWIAFLDADDRWSPKKIEQQLADLATESDCGAHHCGLTMLRADGTTEEFVQKPAVLTLPQQLCRNQALPSATMIRRGALESVGGWSSDRKIGEDWDLGIRLVAAGFRVKFLMEPLVLFRRVDHGNRSSRGLIHALANLRTIALHQKLYRRELGALSTLAVVGRVIHDEGCRRGGLSGLICRSVGRAVALGGVGDLSITRAG